MYHSLKVDMTYWFNISCLVRMCPTFIYSNKPFISRIVTAFLWCIKTRQQSFCVALYCLNCTVVIQGVRNCLTVKYILKTEAGKLATLNESRLLLLKALSESFPLYIIFPAIKRGILQSHIFFLAFAAHFICYLNLKTRHWNLSGKAIWRLWLLSLFRRNERHHWPATYHCLVQICPNTPCLAAEK